MVQAALLSVLQQRREMALLRAAGATPAQATLNVLTQIAAPGIMGGLLGALGGAAFGSGLVSFVGVLRNLQLPLGLEGWYNPVLVALALTLAVAVPMAVMAGRRPVSAALREE